MFTIIPRDLDINFLGLRKNAMVVSAVLLVICIGAIFGIGPKYGIDFEGGIEIQVAVLDNQTIDAVRAGTKRSGYESFEVQSYGDDNTQFLIRVKQPEGVELKELVQTIEKGLQEELGADKFTVERQEFVGPKAGQELRKKGLYAILFSLIGILFYVSLRFELSFAVGAVAALFHDVMLVVGFFILIGHEFNLQIVAALLTIVGYSLNDTIVVFDRIRENLERKSKANLEVVMNRSINEMLSRTILTSLTTLFTAVSIYVLSAQGSVIKDFALALIAGIVVGTYSSVYVASPAVLAYEASQKKKS